MKMQKLHRHLELESKLSLDEDHVIVNKKDWKRLNKVLEIVPALITLLEISNSGSLTIGILKSWIANIREK